jgi:RNA polymerase sigma-70 factor (ECF subfamily)
MPIDVETRARAGDEQAFRALTEPYRRELEVHCYRILGSPQDAEDLVQETLLAAWRGLERFEGRSSVRTWLYRIATNRCLNALRDASRRPGETAPDLPPDPPEPTRIGEPLWLQPYPDALLEGIPDHAPGPDQRYEGREALGIAFVTGLQRLPPSQRAVLVLRDVLGYRAAEVAEMLDISTASVNSGLQRARVALESRLPAAGRERAPLPRSVRERELVGRFADAFENGDVDTIVTLLTDDAWLTMPPVPLEYQGPAAIGRFLATVPAGGDLRRFRLVATRANGQPAFGFYMRDEHCPIAHAAGIIVLTLEGGRIAALTAFHDTAVFPLFGLPRTLPLSG